MLESRLALLMPRIAAVLACVLALTSCHRTPSWMYPGQAVVSFEHLNVLLPDSMLDSCQLGAASIHDAQTRAGLSRAGVRSLRMAFHLDSLSDTLVVNYQGDTVNHAFMLDCYVVFFPECQDVECTCLELEAVPGVVYAEPNCRGVIFRGRP